MYRSFDSSHYNNERNCITVHNSTRKVANISRNFSPTTLLKIKTISIEKMQEFMSSLVDKVTLKYEDIKNENKVLLNYNAKLRSRIDKLIKANEPLYVEHVERVGDNNFIIQQTDHNAFLSMLSDLKVSYAHEIESLTELNAHCMNETVSLKIELLKLREVLK